MSLILAPNCWGVCLCLWVALLFEVRFELGSRRKTIVTFKVWVGSTGPTAVDPVRIVRPLPGIEQFDVPSPVGDKHKQSSTEIKMNMIIFIL
jgi:hypothetical protein